MYGVQSDIDGLSDHEEVSYSPEKLIIHNLYETNDTKLVAGHLNNAETIVIKVLDKIVKDGTAMLMEKYLSAKTNGHITKSIANLIEMTLSTEFIFPDPNPIDLREDVEPPLTKMDNWSRSKIESKSKIPIDHVDLNLSRVDTMMSETKKSFFKAKDKAKKFLHVEVKEERLPKPIELQEPVEFNREEEEKRAERERRNRQKEEEAIEAQKRETSKETQARLAKQSQELKNKNYTFSYDGTMIMVQNPKIEKMPPTAYLVGYTISQSTKELLAGVGKNRGSIDSKSTSTVVNPVKSKQKRAPDDEKNFIKLMQTAPPVFDNFVPQPGVSLIENRGTKANPRGKINLTLTDGGLSEGTKLSKKDYLQLTRGGNLSRSNLNGTDKTRTLNDKNLTDGMRTIDTSDPTRNWSIKVDGVREVNMKEKNVRRLQDLPKQIDVNNTKQFDVLLKAIDEQPPLTKIDEKATSRNTTMVIDHSQKTANEEFMMEIMHSKEWGKNVVHSSSVHATLLPKSSQKLMQQSLGIKLKYPRDRATLSVISKSKSNGALLSGLISPHETSVQ